MPTKRKLAVLLIKDKQIIISHFYLINIRIFDYLDSRLSGLFTEVLMSLDNWGSTVVRTKLLHSSLKSIPLFCSIFSACGKNITQFLFSTLHWVRIRMFLVFYELLIIDFVRTVECILNQAQLQVNYLFWLCW